MKKQKVLKNASMKWRIFLLDKVKLVVVSVLIVYCLTWATWLLPPTHDIADINIQQQWLDEVIDFLKAYKTNDEELQELIDYTISRYDTIGVVRFYTLGPFVGLNVPFVPGVTLDTSMLGDRPCIGAAILLHEARHDYFPYFGHLHFDCLERL